MASSTTSPPLSSSAAADINDEAASSIDFSKFLGDARGNNSFSSSDEAVNVRGILNWNELFKDHALHEPDRASIIQNMDSLRFPACPVCKSLYEAQFIKRGYAVKSKMTSSSTGGSNSSGNNSPDMKLTYIGDVEFYLFSSVLIIAAKKDSNGGSKSSSKNKPSSSSSNNTSNSSNENKLAVIAFMPLNEIQIIDESLLSGVKNKFIINRNGASMLFAVEDEQEKIAWFNDMGDAYEKMIKLSGNLAGDNSSAFIVYGQRHVLITGTIWEKALIGDIEQLTKLLKLESEQRGVSIEEAAVLTDPIGGTLLHLSAYGGHESVVQYLLEELKIEPNVLDDNLLSPLHLCGMNLQVARMLLRAGSDINSCDMNERTPLHTVTQKAIVECIRLPPNHSGDNITSYLEVLVDFACTNGVGKENVDIEGYTAFVGCFNTLIKHIGEDGKFHNKCIELFESLLSKGCNINAQRPDGMACIHVAATKFNERLLYFLLSWGAKSSIRDKDGNTPLHIVLLHNEIEGLSSSRMSQKRVFPIITPARLSCARLLIRYGASVNITNWVDQPPLSPLQAAKIQNIDFSNAIQEWENKPAPVAEINILISKNIFFLPSGTDADQPNWVKDSDVDLCQHCGSAFSFISRRHHCRRCGNIFCASCCSKEFTLFPPPQRSSQSQVNRSPDGTMKGKVCPPCFNGLSREVLSNMMKLKNSSILSRSNGKDPLDQIANEREQLFSESDNNSNKKSAAPSIAESASAAASKFFTPLTDALAKTKEALAERGDKLNSLADSTAQMQNNAQNFSDAATKFRKQQEKANSWFPF